MLGRNSRDLNIGASTVAIWRVVVLKDLKPQITEAILRRIERERNGKTGNMRSADDQQLPGMLRRTVSVSLEITNWGS